MRIAVIGGDGTGPEVVAEGLKVLKAVSQKVGVDYETSQFDVSGDRYLAAGGDPNEASIPVVSDEEIDKLREYDAIYLGAVGHPDIAPGILEKGLLLHLRFALDQYVNLRPVTLYPGVATPLAGKGPQDIDFVVVRENTEGLYGGMGGFQYKGTPQEVATQIMCNTRMGVERAIRYAFELCRRRDDKKLCTLVGKTNVLTYAHDLWYRTFMEIGREYGDIKKDYNHVDACCMWFVKNPEYYDTIVVCNMFGDIITDLGAMIQGGMGVAAGGNINPQGVSMFEPIGGSAPKYTGKNVINPIAAISALAMLLRETGNNTRDVKLIDAGDRVESAVRAVTPKMKSQSAGRMGYSTTQVGDMVAAAVTETN
ncbi:MAG: 3-isopropylmalate dehydrogenase [Phycisphaerae bacterium]|jgi:3-isopropylmalate dehydrogenase|nr:3-isopropylmalate dehydrogenase [Phycisphaerae bacterium]MDP7636397.1 3-isopropylmalate dehydrogenase [Phycisphaerae bacterium]